MKNRQPETCTALLLRTQWQLELLTHLMTQEHLLCFQVYQEERAHLIKQRSQALREFAYWLCRMGLQEEMLQLMQQEPDERLERLRQAKQSERLHVSCCCAGCTQKRQAARTAQCSQEKAKAALQEKQPGGAS